MMITKYLQTSYNKTQWFFEIIQPANSKLDKFYIMPIYYFITQIKKIKLITNLLLSCKKNYLTLWVSSKKITGIPYTPVII